MKHLKWFATGASVILTAGGVACLIVLTRYGFLFILVSGFIVLGYLMYLMGMVIHNGK